MSKGEMEKVKINNYCCRSVIPVASATTSTPSTRTLAAEVFVPACKRIVVSTWVYSPASRCSPLGF